jgi:hypothetical protein
MVVAFDRLAVGEDPSTTSAPAARQWAQYYHQLASFDAMVGSVKSITEHTSDERCREAVRQAMPSLVADSERFGRRFDFWEARLAQLSV